MTGVQFFFKVINELLPSVFSGLFGYLFAFYPINYAFAAVVGTGFFALIFKYLKDR